MVTNTKIVFAKIPDTYPVSDEHMVVKKSEIDLDAEIPQGAVLTKTLEISIDPYLRGCMRDISISSYNKVFHINQTMYGFTIVQVIKSNNDKFAVGDLVNCIEGEFAEYSITLESGTALMTVRNDMKDSGFPLSYYIGALGIAGLTAYVGLLYYGRPTKGETLYVSAASGAVGQLVGQMGVNLGLRVVGSAGSDEKVAYLKEIGFDAAFNYKTVDIQQALGEHCPNGIDVYFDNVGGKTLEAAIDHANQFARIVCCGMISQYNSPNPEPVNNLIKIISKSLEVRGFVVSNRPEMVEPFERDVAEWLKSGNIKYREDISQGIESTPEALVNVLRGKNFGKQIVHVADL